MYNLPDNYIEIYYNEYVEMINTILKTRDNTKFKYSEAHHILPKCLNGTDDPENIIYLMPREHFIAHRLLYFMYPNNSGLAYAYHNMSHQKDLRKISEIEYEEAKISTYEIRCKEAASKRLGKTHTEESRRKISESNRGKHRSAETCTRISESLKGKTYTRPIKQYKCIMCGKIFDAKGTSKYCSYECNKQYNKVSKVCIICGKPVRPPHTKYCSDECSGVKYKMAKLARFRKNKFCKYCGEPIKLDNTLANYCNEKCKTLYSMFGKSTKHQY